METDASTAPSTSSNYSQFSHPLFLAWAAITPDVALSPEQWAESVQTIGDLADSV